MAAAVGLALGVLITNGLVRQPAQSAGFPERAPSSAARPELAEEAPAPAPTTPETGVYAVDKVISGDTLMLETLGPARLLGVDTAQGPGGKAPAPEMAKALLQRMVEGKHVIVDYDPATAATNFKDGSDLPLVYVTLDDGTLVNQELVARGGAVADLSLEYKRRDDLIRAERDARWSGRGVWEASVAKQQLTPLAPGNLPSVQRPPVTTESPAGSVPADAVLVTPDGRFHRQSCPLGKRGVPMSAADARAKRYLACPQCFVSPKVKI